MTRLFALLALAGALSTAPAFAGGESAPSAPAPEPEARGGRAITHVESYVSLEPILAAVQADMRLRGVMHIELGLDVPDARLRREVEAAMPYLRNAYNSTIAVYTGVHYRFGEVPDADTIARMLQNATDETLGREGAQVLLGMVMVNGR
ncbi:Tat pathway signal protein [Marinicauda algicola]|uniref:Tat pathway signal protein n=1 Tax=Marinicauda algicola TaxID=2029849 RepID=A0A4S2H054_9PROT|nr:Tat pathway signal protein [Marinicauda algicola]TGY88856.1 Tat pathway signal protein [Marinicauda algicola]